MGRDLFPDDPEEIRLIYRGLRTREALERVAFRDFDEGYLSLARGIDVVLVLGLPLMMPPFNQGLGSYTATIGGYVLLALATYAFYHVLGRGLLQHRYGRFHPYVERPGRFWALGPASFLFLILALPKRIAPEEIDPASLDVLEPVAREIAAPLLARAREAAHDPLERETDARIAEINDRLAELGRERDEEPDAGWRAKMDRRAIALEIRRDTVLADAARLAESREAVLYEAHEVERGLDRLARRRRLLAEMREGEGPEHSDTELGDLRDRLAALSRSVAEIDRQSGERVGAEEEMRSFLEHKG